MLTLTASPSSRLNIILGKAPAKLKKFLLAFVLTFNWCAWHIRCQVETDPSMHGPSSPDLIHNKIVDFTIANLNRQYAVSNPTLESRLPKLASHPGDISAMRLPFQDMPRAFALSPHDNNFRPLSSAELHELGIDINMDESDPFPDWDVISDDSDLCDMLAPASALAPRATPSTLRPPY